MDNLAVLALSDSDRALLAALKIAIPEDAAWPLDETQSEYEFFPGD